MLGMAEGLAEKPKSKTKPPKKRPPGKPSYIIPKKDTTPKTAEDEKDQTKIETPPKGSSTSTKESEPQKAQEEKPNQSRCNHTYNLCTYVRLLLHYMNTIDTSLQLFIKVSLFI